MCPFSAAGGDLKGLRGTRVAVADFGPALPGWDAEQLARCMEFLIGEGIEVSPVPIDLPAIGSLGRPVTTLDLAMSVDRDDGPALAVAAAHASRHSATFRAFWQKLQEAGKPVKAALAATARKLLSVLNSMVVNGTYFREVQPT